MWKASCGGLGTRLEIRIVGMWMWEWGPVWPYIEWWVIHSSTVALAAVLLALALSWMFLSLHEILSSLLQNVPRLASTPPQAFSDGRHGYGWVWWYVGVNNSKLSNYGEQESTWNRSIHHVCRSLVVCRKERILKTSNEMTFVQVHMILIQICAFTRRSMWHYSIDNASTQS